MVWAKNPALFTVPAFRFGLCLLRPLYPCIETSRKTGSNITGHNMNERVQRKKSDTKGIRRNPAIPASEQWGKRNSAGVAIASGLTFEGIGHDIGGHAILDDVSFDVAPGRIACLLGPSGSGKTTLLRIAAGLVRATRGSVKIDGQVVADSSVFMPPERRGVGLVFQDYALFPHLTILQNVEFGLTALNRTDARKQAMNVLSRVGLEARADEYPHILSGGEQQRVALARALAPRPGILMMDEPFSGLDSRLRDTVREKSLELLHETRSTAIIVTHDPEEALRVGDQIALIREGRLVQQGSGHDLYYRPQSLFAARFFSELNVLPATVSGGQVETAFGRTPANTDNLPGKNAYAAIRLADIGVSKYQTGRSGKTGKIIARRFIGTSELIEASIEGLDIPLRLRIKAGSLAADVDLVTLTVNPARMMLFPAD